MSPRLVALAALLTAALPGLARAEIVGEVVEYTADGVTFEGYRAYDNAVKDARPGVLVIHQWTGLSDYEKRRAKQLAGLGYTVFALDVYGKGVRPQPPAAGAESGKYKNDRALLRKRLAAGLEVLTKDPRTDAKRVAALGYCFGGMGALELARSGADVRGVISFHGALSSPAPADAKNIKGEVLALHGADDPYVPAAEVEAFKKEMSDAATVYSFIAYPGAVHAFTQIEAGNDNSKGAAYNAEADKKSWDSASQFLARVLK